MVLGVLSDTHGLLRPEALTALRDSDRILHLGDVGAPAILDALGQVAPVTVVRGNIDVGVWAAALPETAVVEAAGLTLYMIHNLTDLVRFPAPPNAHAILSGHSHRPSIQHRDGALHLNPGSCGPRRFRLPVTLALVRVWEGRMESQIVQLLP